MRKYSIIILLIISMSIISVPLNNNVIGDTTLEYVILFDESHGQYFNRTLMSTALDSLNSLLPNESTTEIKIDLLFQEESDFNSTNLQGIDLLIFTNPGLGNENGLSSLEINAILDFVELGGSLFLLCNPLTQNVNITGHREPINDLLASRDNRLTSARIRSGQNASYSDVIVDDYLATYSNESFLTLPVHNSTHTIFNQEIKLNETLVYTSSITLGNEQISDTSLGLGKTPITSYSVDEDYSIFRDPANNFLTWLLAKEIENSRMLLSGSTIMFSDLEVAQDEIWIEQMDNLDLWKNIILWLIHFTPHPEVPPPAVWNFGYYALIITSFSFLIFAFAYGMYKYTDRRKKTIKLK
jgi:hypothetical protein